MFPSAVRSEVGCSISGRNITPFWLLDGAKMVLHWKRKLLAGLWVTKESIFQSLEIFRKWPKMIHLHKLVVRVWRKQQCAKQTALSCTFQATFANPIYGTPSVSGAKNTNPDTIKMSQCFSLTLRGAQRFFRVSQPTKKVHLWAKPLWTKVSFSDYVPRRLNLQHRWTGPV